MQRAFEKILSKLEELKRVEENRTPDCNEEGYGDGEQIYDDGRSQGRYEQTNKIIEIVNQVASEHGGGWIPVSSGKLPEENIAVDVTIKEEIEGSTYTDVSWLQEGQWVIKKNPFRPRVTAWKMRPEPYKPKFEFKCANPPSPELIKELNEKLRKI